MLQVFFTLILTVLIMGCNSQDSRAQRPSDATPAVVSTPSVGADATIRTLRFSGYEWVVKAATNGPVGPGPNYFSDGPDTVWVDEADRLHLRINAKDGRWRAAEVISTRSFGYGTYRFYLDTNVDEFDPNVVLGLFTWSDEPAFYHRELDIEISRWGQEKNELGQCVVQPYAQPDNYVRFALPQG